MKKKEDEVKRIKACLADQRSAMEQVYAMKLWGDNKILIFIQG